MYVMFTFFTSIHQAMKIKPFVAREIQYFELGIFSFNSYVYCLTRPFNLLTLLTREFELVTRGFELVTREFEIVTCRFELSGTLLKNHVSCNLC